MMLWTALHKCGCCKVHDGLTSERALRPLRAVAHAFALGRRVRPQAADDLIRYAAASVDQRKGSPERQTLCRITASLRASAILAFAGPARCAMAAAQSFR